MVVPGQNLSCKAPCSVLIDLDQERPFTVEASFKDQKKKEFVDRSINLFTLLNLGFGWGALIGLGVDFYTGAFWKPSPNRFRFDFKEKVEVEEIEGDGTSGLNEEEEDSETPTAKQPIKIQGGDGAVQQTNPVNPAPQAEEEIDVDSPESIHVRELYSSSYLDRQIKYYHGDLGLDDLADMREKVYSILVRQYRAGERIDIDIAIQQAGQP